MILIVIKTEVHIKTAAIDGCFFIRYTTKTAQAKTYAVLNYTIKLSYYNFKD